MIQSVDDNKALTPSELWVGISASIWFVVFIVAWAGCCWTTSAAKPFFVGLYYVVNLAACYPVYKFDQEFFKSEHKGKRSRDYVLEVLTTLVIAFGVHWIVFWN